MAREIIRPVAGAGPASLMPERTCKKIHNPAAAV